MDENQIKVLLVEDNPGDARLIHEMLQEVDPDRFCLRIEGSIAGAISYLKLETPDIILLDLSLPDAIGFESFAQLSARAGDLPIVVLTGLDSQDMAMKAIGSGAQDYLVKGKISAELLTRAIQYALERRKLTSKLQHLAFHDALTGLPNRQLFLDRVEMCFNRQKRNPDSIFAVLFLDIDHFKIVNDTFGHPAGDLLLVEVAKRIAESIRPMDTVARFSGDEFGVLLESLRGTRDIVYVANRILEKMKQDFNFGNRNLRCALSIGITSSVFGYENGEDMLGDADIAMYRAKETGRARLEIFVPGMRKCIVDKVHIETELRRAIEKQEFITYYQPIIDLQTGKIVGCEALVRWQHPERGLVMPDEFIPVADESGLIVPLGEWILHDACSGIGGLNRDLKKEPPLFISVNVSPRQFSQEKLVSRIKKTLQLVGMDPALLKIELTETAIIMNPETVEKLLLDLKAYKMQVSLGDFDTGYSSLSHLHHLSIDSLKIDRSFVAKIDSSPNDLKIVQTIVLLAKSLGIQVIAEGIENERQLKRLYQINCPFGQGYYFSHPITIDALKTLIAQDPVFLVQEK